MVQVIARCPQCGDVELSIDAVSVLVDERRGSGAYSFSCPGCGHVTSRRVSPRMTDTLVSSGAAHSVVATAPFADDDVEYFSRLLADDNRLAWALDTRLG